MRATGRALGREQGVGRGREELEHGSISEGRRVGHVHDDLRSRQAFRDARPGDRVEAGARRRRHRVVPSALKLLDHLRAQPPGPTDDQDLHHSPPRILLARQ
jgi:hypothetical protein